VLTWRHTVRSLGRELEVLEISHYVTPYRWAEKAQSVQRLATGWTVRGSNSDRGEIFRTHPDLPGGPPSLLHNG
jgi:hypothetical protein